MKPTTSNHVRAMAMRLALFSLFFISSFISKSQTTLTQGDMSIISINSNSGASRGVCFVIWVPVSTGTEIRFTDNGFNSTSASTAANNMRWQETVLIWTATGALPAGTTVCIEGEAASIGSANVVNASLGADPPVTVLNLSNTGGDQVFAYQGLNMPTTTTASSGNNALTFNNTILFGIGYQGTIVTNQTTWISTGTTGTATSYLPSDLASPNRIYLAGNATGGQFTGARTGQTTAAAYKTEIANIANWTTYSSTFTNNTTAFTLGTPPAITGNPSGSSICAGANTSFTVTASNPVSYRWQENSGSGYTNISNGGVYSGATTATLTITGATAGMNGYAYRCVVTGSAAPTATSAGATLTVNSAPSITTQPSTASVCNSGNTSFSVVASNATGYQWQENSGSGYTNISNGGVFNGATTATLSITGATAMMSGYVYRVIVSGACTPSATSTGRALTVNSAPAITQNPVAPSAVCEGDATLFFIAASNTTAYQWQVNDGSGYVNVANGTGANGEVYSGVTSSVLIINNTSVSISGFTYRCLASGSCSPSATSTGAAITVLANVTYYEDFDVDGYGNGAVTTVSCTGAPGGFVSNFDDCDDNDSSIYPGAVEVCGDGIDNDCDGDTDENCNVTQVQASQCGTTLALLDSDILADTVVSATTYRFRLIQGANVQTIDLSTPSFKLTQLANYNYNTTYTIDVAIEVGGTWFPYGPACNVSTPAGCLWTGNISQSWSNTGNWSCGVLPTATTNVTIPDYAMNMPVVDITTAITNNITIQSNAMITIGGGNALDIKGTVTNAGIIITLGTAKFSGASQLIPAGTYANLEVAGTGVKTLGGIVTVPGTLNLSQSHIQLDGNDLSIGSAGNIINASASSFIIANSTGTLKQSNIGSTGRTGFISFPVGVAAGSYTPVMLDNTGVSDEFSVRLLSGVNREYDVNDQPIGAPQSNFNVNRVWLVSETVTGGSNATLVFQWNAAEEQMGFNRNNCFVGHYTNENWAAGPGNQMALGMDPYILGRSNITAFSPFGVGSSGSTLPVTLLSFSGNSVAGGVKLKWKTDNELNFSHFEIQRSTDGSSFSAIGNVSASNSAGVHEYSFTDAFANSRNVYYRLRQVDMNGQFTYSAVVLFTGNQQKDGLMVYPNPVVSQANVTVRLSQPGKTSFSLFDNNGRMIRVWQQELQAGSTGISINMEGLAAGVYHLELTGAGSPMRARLMKQ